MYETVATEMAWKLATEVLLVVAVTVVLTVRASPAVVPTVATFQSIATAATAYITALDTQRAALGGSQNQIEYSVTNLMNLSSNLAQARSRIIDTDYASETATLTKGQILQQAATAMLAQANQMPNVILSLLK